MKSWSITVAASWSLIFNFINVQGALPGIRSIKQCYKYYNLEFSLRELDSFIPLSSNELEEILEQERNEKDPEWALGAVGGQNALPKEYPFMAALGYGNETNKIFLCGGSLISEQFILTAAHCIFAPGRGVLKYIRLGDLNITSSTDDDGAQEFAMSEYFVHPNYSFPRKYNDIAVVKLDGFVTFTEYVKPVCLEYERSSLKYQLMYAAGWGLLGYGEEPSDHLQKVMLKHYTLKSCQKTYSADATLPKGIIDDSQICAGGIINITDTCEGDSGGPLMYLSLSNGPPIYYLTGVTSFGIPCGLAKLPAIYTRVSLYIQWIEDIIWPENGKLVRGVSPKNR